MKENDILLTIGMPVYNEEKYIAETIESLLLQTYKDFILIISDNGSTDQTSEICNKYAAKDRRIKYIRHDRNMGGFYSFKYILDRINTPFFMLAGGHDKWHPQFIEKLLPIIRKEDLVLIYPKAREIEINGAMGSVYEEDYTTAKIDNPASRYSYVLKNMGTCNVIHGIWKTKAIKDCNVKKPTIAGDVLILLKASFLGKFKQKKEELFFRRTVREEKNEFSRQIYHATADTEKKRSSIFFLKGQFVLENIKIAYGKDFKLGFSQKIFLSIQTIYVWLKKIYIRPFLISILKKCLPKKSYLFLEAKLKNKVKKYL